MGAHRYKQPSHPRRRRGILRPAPLVALALATAFVLPGAGGPAAAAHPIGRVSVTWHDAERGDRPVPLEIYYPAQYPGNGAPPAATEAAGFPVVAFGHAYLQSWERYRHLWEALVPAGYVLAFPRTEMTFLADHAAFARDLAFAVRRLREEGATPGSLFHGVIGPTAAAAGHSLGGGASVLAAAGDPSLDAVANLAALETVPSAIRSAAAVSQPALVICAGRDCVTPPAEMQEPMYENLGSSHRTLVEIEGGSHCRFAAPDSICDVADAGCPEPLLPREEQQAVTRLLLRPWLDAVLRDDAAAWATFRGRLDSLPDVAWRQAGQVPLGTGDGGDDAPAGPDAEDGAVALELAPDGRNPFRERTGLRFRLDRAQPARLAVYALDGRRLRVLADGVLPAGWHERAWDGRDAAGRPVAAGVYLCRLELAGRALSRKLLRLR